MFERELASSHCRRVGRAVWGVVVASSLTASAWGQAPGPSTVAIAPVTQQDVAAGRTFVGTVMPVRSATVGSAVDGRVMEFLINEGDRVAKGQKLCQIRTRTLELQLAAAKAELASREQKLAELKNGSRPEEIEQARARMVAAQAESTYAKARFERKQTVFNRQAGSQEDLDEAAKMAAKAAEAEKETKAAYELVINGARAEQIAQAEAEVAYQTEEIARQQDIIDRHTIVAPFDGFITKEHTEEGEWLVQGGPVVEIVELDEVDIEALVLEDYIGYLDTHTPARVEVGALPNETFTGQVAAILPQADLKSRSFPVKVRVQNRPIGQGMLLKAGMFARVTLPVGVTEAAVLVPKDALVLGGDKPQVFRFTPGASKDNGQVSVVPVTLGVAMGTRIQVQGDLKPGEFVVVEGNERLRPGETVQAKVRPETPIATKEPPGAARPAAVEAKAAVGKPSG